MTDTLLTGQTLNEGQQLTSPNGRFRLWMQTDGNLVLYDGPPAVSSAYWSTGTWQIDPSVRPTYAEMQADGHLVLYNNSRVPAWGSGVWGPAFTNPFMSLQDDGNLVIYEGTNNPIWASQTVRTNAGPAAVPVSRTETTEVGWGKRMTTTATLYRNGRLTVDSEQRNDNLTGALRGRILVICSDDQARMIWISSVLNCPTRCSIPDVSCASYGRVSFQEDFPEAIGEYATTIDLLQADNPNYVDLRATFVETIKTAQDLAPAIMAVIGLLA
jgi:hypothetical protein